MAEDSLDRTAKSRVSDDQLDHALNDQRYLRRQIKCALGEAPCDPVGRRLKSKSISEFINYESSCFIPYPNKFTWLYDWILLEIQLKK